VRLLQIVLVGAAAGIVCGVFTLMLELAVLMARVSAVHNDGAGGLGAVSTASWAPIVALVGFLLGALWQYRRSS
jgi:hypothetical protein